MRKISILLLSTLFGASCIIAQVTTNSLVDRYNGGASQVGMISQPSGGYVVLDYSGNEAKITTALPGPVPAYSFTGWYTSPSNFKLQQSPFVKFKAKRTTAKSQNFIFKFKYTDNTSGSFTKTAALTTVYQDFSWDLASDIATLEAGGKTVDKLEEIQIPLIIGNDDGIYLDDVFMGDSASPCVYSYPTIDVISSKSMKFNQITPLDVAMSGITDGGTGKTPISITVESSDLSIANTKMVSYNSPDATGSIQIIGAQPPKKGSVTFTVTVSDLASCNSNVTKTFALTVGSETLDFTINPVTKTINADAGEQIIAITGITNIGYGNTPDNYRGLTMKAEITSGAANILSYTSNIVIDSAGGGVAELRYIPNPALTGTSTFAISLESKWGATKKTVNHTVTITDPLDVISPTAPKELTATSITATGFTLGWVASTDNVGVTGYDAYNGSSLIGSASSTSNTMNVTGLSPNTTYNVSLKARDASGNLSDASNSIPVVTLKALLTISANNITKKVGDANPTFTLTYSGFVNADNVSVLNSIPTASCIANESSPVGNYVITVSGGIANNYDILYNSGVLTVLPSECSLTATINNSSIPDLCVGDSIKLMANIEAGATYLWYQDGSIVQAGPSNSLFCRSAGNYYVSVSALGCLANSNPVTIKYKSVGAAPIIQIKSGTIGNCNTDGTIYLGPSAYYSSYAWSNGEITPSIMVKKSGKYTLTVPDPSGCSITSAPLEINFTESSTPSICIVTVNQTTEKNTIVWQHATGKIKKYKIYKETSKANQFTVMDSVSSDALNMVVDENSNAHIRSNRYRVSAIDSCGKETPLSEIHKTLHLTLGTRYGGGLNLIWENYEGLNFDSYVILEGNSPSTMNVLTEIPSNITSYTILDSLKSFYQIAIKLSEICNTNVLKADADSFTFSYSNIVEYKETKLISLGSFYAEIYPNPASDAVTVVCEKHGVLMLTDLSGRIITQTNIQCKETKIDVSELPAGCYIIFIQSEDGIATSKLIVE